MSKSSFMYPVFYIPFNFGLNDLDVETRRLLGALEIRELTEKDIVTTPFLGITLKNNRIYSTDLLTSWPMALKEEHFYFCFDRQKWSSYLDGNRPKKNEPFGKSLNLKKYSYQVIDATSGTGRDSLHLARLGAKVYAFERFKLSYLLLKDAQRVCLETNTEFKWINNINLHYGDVCDQQNDFTGIPLYYDPMYSANIHKQKSLPKKEMVYFQNLHSSSDDNEAFFTKASKLNLSRIIFKRPLKEVVFNHPLWTFNNSFKGATTRYDLYLLKKEES